MNPSYLVSGYINYIFSVSVSVCKRLHSRLNIMSLVAVKKRKGGKIGKVEIKWIEK